MRITKTFTFEAGHRLSNYEGKCKRFHGHGYFLELTVEGEMNSIGMVIDFGELKRIFEEIINNKFDHRMILMRGDKLNKAIGKALSKGDNSICWVDYNPTAENISYDIAEMIQNELIPSVKLVKVKLYETPTSYAELII
jgi:6-pyruvoyltetrahydropterin/6-carboxytetrahydropterin synthase